MFSQVEKKKIPILMYHSISQIASSKFKQFAVPPRLFAEQMAHLHQHGYTPITVTQFVNTLTQEEAVLPDRPIILTFDDGYADFLTEALPVLARYDFAATIYITTAFVDGTSRWLRNERETARPMLTWRQIAEINAGRIECGAHSHSHPQLDTLPCTKARDEILQSKRLLEEHLGQNVCSFAYPFGYHNARVRQLVREAGYTSACAVRHTTSSVSDDFFSLARLMISSDCNIKEFASLITGRSSSFTRAAYKLYARARTPVWQIFRRGAALVAQRRQEEGLAC